MKSSGRAATRSSRNHLRVGQITADNEIPEGHALTEQRLDETEGGEGTTVTLINISRRAQTTNLCDCAEWHGLNPWTGTSVCSDLVDAVLSSGDLIVMITWIDRTAADACDKTAMPRLHVRMRRVRIVRDCGKYARREAPQYYADAKGQKRSTRETIHP